MTQPTKAQAIERIRRALGEIPALMSMPRYSQEFTKWHWSARLAIEFAFGEDSRHIRTFNNVKYGVNVVAYGPINHRLQEDYERGLERANCYP